MFIFGKKINMGHYIAVVIPLLVFAGVITYAYLWGKKLPK